MHVSVFKFRVITLRHIFSYAISLVAGISLALCAQSVASTLQSKPANAWMKIPTRVDVTDHISPALRTKRNALFDAVNADAQPLTPENSSSFHVSEGSHFTPGGQTSRGGPDEIPKIQNRTIILGTFKDFTSILTPSKKTIYTEVRISVDYIFESTGNSIATGERITIALRGGSIETRAGELISYEVDPREYFLQPNKQYLLVLSFNPEGRFYELSKDWEISKDIVQASSRVELIRSQTGQSTLVGLTKEKLLSFLQAELAGGR